MLEWEMNAHQDEEIGAEIVELSNKLIKLVIPRLLRPLESEGRSVTPVLVHGDLWPGNVKHDTPTGRVIIFDSGACWGHDEGKTIKIEQEERIL